MLNRHLISSVLLTVAAVGCSEDPAVDVETSALSLPGSKFEIDDNANLMVNTEGNSDWASVDDVKKVDTASGQNDDSFKGGSKEDDVCPAVETGSIPNNKSDLKTFGVYAEPGGVGNAGFLHLFWTRVQDPSGTTLMDFEFNQSSTKCANGVNPTRTVGDLLLEYRLESGGATASIKLREWNGSMWGAATDLSATGAATGTINANAISAANADGLGALDPRTFGEASIDLDYIFKPDKCVSFGSAFVKSRSSDAFNSALKDFIAPTPINITNCGKVVIRKQTTPNGLPDSFAFSHTLKSDPATSSTTFQLADDGVQQFTNVLFGTGYTVTEDALPAGFELANIDCSASVGVTPTTDLAAGTVTFDIDDESDIVDCTYTNQAKGKLVIEKVSTDAAGTFNFTSGQLPAFALATSGAGVGGKASKLFDDLDPGTYSVTESVPQGWTLVGATCSDGSPVSAIDVGPGETVTCTFVNERQRGAIRIVKTRKHAASGPGYHPHAGVSFVVSGGGLVAPMIVVTNASGEACLDGLVLSSFVGNYTVTEAVPAGYVPEGDAVKTVAVTTAASCPAGDLVTFSNIPLTNLTVSVDSVVPGGTASTITCTGLGTADSDASGDAALTLSSLLPGSYTCTVVIH